MASVYDYDPTGYREWFMNSAKYRFGTINHPQVTLARPLNNVVAVTILEAQLPYTFYTINNNNNKLYLLVPSVFGGFGGGGPSILVASITPGNYTSSTITAAILAAMLKVWPGASDATVTYNESTGKLTFGTNGLEYGLLFKDRLNTCSTPLGFDINNPTDYYGITTSTPLTAPFSIALGGPSFLMVRGSFGLGGADDIMVNTQGNDEPLNGNIIAAIPVNTVPGGTITWKNLAPRGGFFNFPVDKIAEAEFWVTMGDDDTQVDFNGHPFQLKIAFLTRQRNNSLLGSAVTMDRGVTSSVRY